MALPQLCAMGMKTSVARELAAVHLLYVRLKDILTVGFCSFLLSSLVLKC